MFYLLNNCRNLNHADLYGGNAFFDLWVGGREEEIAKELHPGDTCWVASYRGLNKTGRTEVVLAKYKFTRTRRAPSPEAPYRMIWVLDGDLEQRQVLAKSKACEHVPCSRLFNKRGQFKQVSVVRCA